MASKIHSEPVLSASESVRKNLKYLIKLVIQMASREIGERIKH